MNKELKTLIDGFGCTNQIKVQASTDDDMLNIRLRSETETTYRMYRYVDFNSKLIYRKTGRD